MCGFASIFSACMYIFEQIQRLQSELAVTQMKPQKGEGLLYTEVVEKV